MEIGISRTFIDYNWNNNCRHIEKFVNERKIYLDFFYFDFQHLCYFGFFNLEKKQTESINLLQSMRLFLFL